MVDHERGPPRSPIDPMFSGVFRLHFDPYSMRITASNDGRPGPGGRADVPRGRGKIGKIRRSGLNKPQLGTDAETENGVECSEAGSARILYSCVERVRRVWSSIERIQK